MMIKGNPYSERLRAFSPNSISLVDGLPAESRGTAHHAYDLIATKVYSLPGTQSDELNFFAACFWKNVEFDTIQRANLPQRACD
jgi:hypothetical protein